MSLKYRRMKGTRDILLEEMERWRWCEDRWMEVLARYGYGEIRTPILEPTELFLRSVGEGTDIVDKEMYTFLTKGGDSLTLRPEMTASVVRAYLENGAWVGGGWGNTASGEHASVSGGHSNTASGVNSSVSGGYINTASGASSSVIGGFRNEASGHVSSVSGGGYRSATGEWDWAAGSLWEDQ